MFNKYFFVKLKKNNLNNYLECLNNYPKKYINYELKDPLNYFENDLFVFKGLVINKEEKLFNNKLYYYNIEILYNNNLLKLYFFNKKYLFNKITIDNYYYFAVKYNNSNKQYYLDDLFINFKNYIKPIYNLDDISDLYFQNYIKYLINNHNFKENLPINILKKYHFPFKKEFYEKIHFPKSKEDIIQAYTYLKYIEIYMFIKKWNKIKEEKDKLKGISINYDIIKVKEEIKKIPFELTVDQKNTINEIFKDLKSNKSMNRLIQADVGSGKTITAFISILAVLTTNYQVAFMAPTEILAMQHYNNFNELFNKGNKYITTLLISKTKNKDEIINDINGNKIKVIFGTHALFQEKVKYNNLGLVIIDEEQRFGVEQRKSLIDKGNNPNYLVLTATPIPRTMALYFYNEYDLSIIKTKPKRGKVYTKILDNNNQIEAYKVLDEEINKKNQAYIVMPFIDEHEYSIDNLYNKLKEKYNIYYMHGKLKDEEKNKIINDFINKKFDILLSTTVIEVGVDNKDATVILIYEANRFGINQLHQLRGRVGRSYKDSYCFLITNDINNKKLKAIEKYNDGFILSEIDLKLRGYGDITNNQQTGNIFKFFNLKNDLNILKNASLDLKNNNK